jgi:hypothetical protein
MHWYQYFPRPFANFYIVSIISIINIKVSFHKVTSHFYHIIKTFSIYIILICWDNIVKYIISSSFINLHQISVFNSYKQIALHKQSNTTFLLHSSVPYWIGIIQHYVLFVISPILIVHRIYYSNFISIG